jgi:hypothetical protein
MDYGKTKLTPVDDDKKEPSTEAQKYAKEQLMRERAKTQKFKSDYFLYYDDVKINHREDW